MLRYIFILLLLPLFLFGQEQVSDIKYQGIYYPTLLTGNVGFASINGTQYLLQENDSLIIFKFEGDTVKFHSTISNFNGKSKSNAYVHPNRSLFDIKNGLYYRFLISGLQVIDIEAGVVQKQYDLKSKGIDFIYPIEIFNNKLYFSQYTNSQRIFYILDLSSGNMSTLDIPANRSNSVQVENQIAGIEDSNKVYIFNVETKVDSLIYESQLGIKWLSYSEKDSTNNFMEEDGRLWKIDTELNLINTNCSIPSSENLKSFKVNGDKLIAIYNYIPGDNGKDSVIVMDINTCEKDTSFITETIPYYAIEIQHVVNERNDENFTIFGYVGSHPGDGYSQGLYYFIDHNKNNVTSLNDITLIQSYTPFLFKNAIYCIGETHNGWYTYQFIIKQDLNTSKITKLYPGSANTTVYSILGYPENNELINATNNRYENAILWKLGENDKFTEIQPLDFLFNLGINRIKEKLSLKERLYFTNYVGLYSVLDDCKIEIPFNKVTKVFNYGRQTEIATYRNNIAFAEYDKDKLVIKILNTKTNTLDSIFDYDVKPPNVTTIAIGSLIFYNLEQSKNKVRYFDLKSNSIHVCNELPYISDNTFTEGHNKAIYMYTDVNTNLFSAFHIDSESNEIKKLDFDFDKHVNVVVGYDNSFYLVDHKSDASGSRIRLLKNSGDLSTIYSGDGNYIFHINYSHDLDNPVTTIHLLHNNNTSIIITNDLEKTDTLKIPILYSYSTTNIFLNTFKDKFVLKTRDSLRYNYWFYEAFKPIINLNTPTDKYFSYSDISDSLAIMVYFSKDSIASLIKYDYNNHIYTIIENIESDCGIFTQLKGIPINRKEYLFNMKCNVGYEPYILDITEGSLKLLADINPGSQSSDPGNFTKFKDWIYFTATIKDKSTQWFRIPTGLNTKVIDLIESHIHALTIYPSPASQTISMVEDLEHVSIYTMQGQLVLQFDNYMRNEPVSIGYLENGLYMVYARNKEDIVMLGRFIKVE